MDAANFVQNVKTLCQQRGVKPTVACKESGVGGSFINDIERGRVPSVSKVQMIASYLGVTTSELLGESARAAPDMDVSALEERSLEADPLLSTLLHNFDLLNQEGQERLVETSDDMVSSGKYIKTGPVQLGNEKFA